MSQGWEDKCRSVKPTGPTIKRHFSEALEDALVTEIPMRQDEVPLCFRHFGHFVRLSLTPVFVVNPKVDVAQKGCGYENGSNLATINEEEKRSLQEQVAILSEDATLGDASEAKDDDLEAPSDLGAELTEEGSLGKENVEQAVENEIRAKDPGTFESGS